MPVETEPGLAESIKAWSGRFEFEDSVILINIPQVPCYRLDPRVAKNKGYFAYPPHGLLYLAAVFRALGVPCEILDLNYDVLRAFQMGKTDWERVCRDKIAAAVARRRKPLIGLSFLFDATAPALEAVSRFLKSRYPDLCVAAGGVAATADPELLLRRGWADVVFGHEAETTVPAFYRFLRGETSDPPVNMAFLDGGGSLRRTASGTGGAVDLDIRAEYKLIPIADYHRAGSLSNYARAHSPDAPFSPVLAKRGCRAFCSFCGVRGFNGKGVRLRDADGVVDEMSFLRERYGIGHFDWLDDDLLFDKKATLKLFETIARRLPGITWAANNGLIASALDSETLEAMRLSGCVGFKVGLETGSPELMRKTHRPTQTRQFLDFAKLAEGYPEMFVVVNLILGMPDETFGQMKASLKLSIDSRLGWRNFHLYQHLKSTEFYADYGSLGGRPVIAPHGRENEGPDPRRMRNYNPVREGVFNGRSGSGAASGYEVFQLDAAAVPSPESLREIWFTFNAVGNILLNPCLGEVCDARLEGTIRWLEVLAQAYPDDASLVCLEYFLKRKAGRVSKSGLERVRSSARRLFRESAYWRRRDRQFQFSSFLDGKPPRPALELGSLAPA